MSNIQDTNIIPELQSPFEQLREVDADGKEWWNSRFAPSVCLPHDWRIAMQMVYYTKSSPIREATGVPVYGCLSVNKQIGRHWSFGIDWHDMFDAFCSEAVVNRHAATVKLQYRF